MRILNTDDSSLEEAVSLLKNDEVIAFPTETVLGLGASLFSDRAIEKLFHIKKRSFKKPFTAHICDIGQVERIARDIPKLFYKIAEKFLPGPLTIILKKQPSISSLVTAGDDTIGIRCPNHEVALGLLKKCPFPLAASSANISGFSCLHKSSDLLETFESLAAIIEGGSPPEGTASTVISLVNPDKPLLLRKGSFAFDNILSLLKN